MTTFNPQPKGAPRKTLKARKGRADVAQLKVLHDAVWTRDGGRCRRCHCAVYRTPEAHPRRGEVHHLHGRRSLALRWESRCALLICWTCHQRITGTVGLPKLYVVGERFITIPDHFPACINTDWPVLFTEARL